MRGKELIWKEIQNKNKPLQNTNIVPTFDVFPTTLDYKDENIILGLTLKPFGFGQHAGTDYMPEICFGINGIIRCEICKSYMNPYNLIDVAKSSYYCCICGWYNTLPTHYHPTEDNIQLRYLTYDIVPFNNQFTNKKVSEPHIVFLIEATFQFLSSDAYKMLLSAVEYSLEIMDEKQNVMLVTYDWTHVHAYDLRGEGTRYILSLDQKPMCQSLSRQIRDVKNNLMKILRILPELYTTPNFQKRNILSRRGMQYSIQSLFKIGGKIIHFLQNYIPAAGIANAPKNKQEGFYSSTLYYQKISRICNEQTINYNIFLFSNVQSNVIQVADVCLKSKGFFKLYRKSDSVEQFYYDLIQVLSQKVGYSITSRLRYGCNTIQIGTKTTLSDEWQLSWVRPYQNSQLVAYSSIHPDTYMAITVNLKSSFKEKYLFLQNSCLYIQTDGKIKLRISNAAIPLSQKLLDVHNSSNYEGLSSYFLKNEMELFIRERGVVKTMQQRLFSLCKLLVHYKKYSWTHDVILLSMGLLKNRIGVKQKGMMFTKKRLQQMWVNILSTLQLNPIQMLTYFVPQLFKVQPCQSNQLPPLLALSNTSIQPQSSYILLCGKTIIIYYSQNYSGPRLHTQDSPINPIIDNLSALNNYKHYKLKQTSHNQFADQAYQQFMNYLLYSDGLYERRCSYEQFLQILN